MLKRIKKSTDYINKHCPSPPLTGIILGSGLGSLAETIEPSIILNYSEIPYFPKTSTEGHEGKLIIGKIAGKMVAVLKGRLHFYEGYSMDKIIFPVRVLKFLGIKWLFLTNAGGGLNPDFEIGDIMIITDHINLMPNPLVGNKIKEFGSQFPDMSKAYDERIIRIAEQVAAKNQIKIKKGCYVGVTGPSFETPKEYEYYRIIGGDAVGMSTVPEVIAARQMNISCFAVSVITDMGVPGKISKITHADVLHEADKIAPKISVLFRGIMNSM
ncbi:MAG: purine-nucleoside phosphorylase [Bacteroidales bacterium]|nr:purine-nucleoside phosphorylase [Bacteroidales bacterium]